MSYAGWTPTLDALLMKHFARMPFDDLSKLTGRSVSSLKNRANKLKLKRDPDIASANRSAAGKAAVARARESGKTWGGKPLTVAPQPTLRETGPDQLAYRKARLKAAAEAMVEHGVDPNAATLAVHVIVQGRVPGVRWEI